MKVEVVDSDEERDSAAKPAADQDSQGSAEEIEVEATPIDADTDAQSDAPAAGAAEAASADDAQATEQKPVDDPVTSDDEVFSLEDLKKARAAAKEANDRYMRLEAEWDNYRKRTAREREDERERAAESLVEKLLPVMDDLERALAHAATQQPEGAFSQFVDGIEAVHTKFASVFEKAGVQVIDPAGEPFDANEHQAVGHVDDPQAYDETVRDVYQKGYRVGKHVLRPAMVTVTKGGPRRPAEPVGDANKAASEGDKA